MFLQSTSELDMAELHWWGVKARTKYKLFQVLQYKSEAKPNKSEDGPQLESMGVLERGGIRPSTDVDAGHLHLNLQVGHQSDN
jgi:hypothetical protein